MEAQTSEKPSRMRPKSPREFLYLLFSGFLMGSVEIIPGVSGGTMAFILGIYEDLINAIKSFDTNVIKKLTKRQFKEAINYLPLPFLFTLGIGMLVAIFTLAQVLSVLLDEQPVYVFAFFFGLILASIIAIGAKVRWAMLPAIMLVIGAVVAFIIVNLVPTSIDDPTAPGLFFGGMVAVVALILPGVSGSFILLVLGLYDFVLGAVSNRDIGTLIIVVLGCLVGILGFSRVLSWLLKHHEQATVATLVGFMIGSLWRIWPWKEVLETRIDRHGETVPALEANALPNGDTVVLAIVLMIIGFLIVSVLDHVQEGNNPVLRWFWSPNKKKNQPTPVETV